MEKLWFYIRGYFIGWMRDWKWLWKKKLENVDWIGTQHLFLICSDPDNSIYSKHFSRDCIIYVEKLIW